MRGELAPGWKGGKSPDSRWTPEYRAWRNVILRRDHWCCVKCGSKEKIQVDHIRGWTKYPKLRLRPSNGRVLCWTCHKKRKNHGRGRWQQFTGKQATREADGMTFNEVESARSQAHADAS